jgi:hypothetical protein
MQQVQIQLHKYKSVKHANCLQNIDTPTIEQGHQNFEEPTVSVMAPGRPSKKAGQPQPESNFVVDLYNGVPHAAHS